MEVVAEFDDLQTNEEHSSARKSFSLRAFSEMQDPSNSAIIPQDLYKNPRSVVEMDKGIQQTSDDSVITRLTMGKMAAFEASQKATTTTARRPNDKLYMCPSNTFIASNGDVYEIEPFMLPPPTEIAALFKELKDRRDRSDSVTIESDTRTPKLAFKQKANKNVDLNDTNRVFLLSKPSNEKQIDRLTVPTYDSPINQKFCRSRSKEMKSSPRAKALNSKGPLKNDKAGVTTSVVIAEDIPSEKESESDNGSTQSRSDIISRQSLARYRNRNLNNTNNSENSRKPESSIGAYPTFLHTDQPGQKNRDEEMFDWDNFSIKKYLLTEMLGVGETGHLQPAAVGHMQNFLTVPSKVEAFVGFGFFICLDAFLNVLTFLPLRMAYSLGLLGCEVLGNVLLTVLGVSLIASASQYKSLKKSLRGRFQMCHLYDLMRGVFMLISCYVLLKLNMSRVYHYIRGQTLIKLYVLSAMLEIFDKLLCSFGQDAFDSLYCITRMRPDPRSIVFAFIVTAVYTTLHSGLYFMSIATLTVAINSADQALVTVLVLNNFGEIKSFVFKKFDNQNLFQLSCADVTERFQLVLFLLCISGVALSQAGPTWLEILPTHIVVIFMMVSSEAIADWIKHAFISKFNHISANVYDDFTRVLRKDILNCHKDKVVDQTYAITKRVGLAQIPLGCVFIRYLILALSSPAAQGCFLSMSQPALLLVFMFWFSIFVLCKIAVGLGLIRYAGAIHNEELRLRNLEQIKNSNATHRFETMISMNQLSNIERFTVYKGRVVG